MHLLISCISALYKLIITLTHKYFTGLTSKRFASDLLVGNTWLHTAWRYQKTVA